MPASDDTTVHLPAASPSSNSHLLDDRESIADYLGAGFAKKSADETSLVKEFIRIADAANADPQTNIQKTAAKLIPFIWYLTHFVPTPSFLDQQMAAREILAAHGHDVEPYEFWIATSLGCAMFSRDAFERWPSIVPKAWHPVNVKPDEKRSQRCAADILRTALRCHYEGVVLRALLDQVLGVRFMSGLIDCVGYSPSVKMRLDSLTVIFIGDKPSDRERKYKIVLDWEKEPVTKVSQVMAELDKSCVLPPGWTVVPPLTCVDPFYYDAHIPRSAEEPMPRASHMDSIKCLGSSRDRCSARAVMDHRRAPREAAEDTALEAVTSTRTTLQLLGEVDSGDYHRSTMLWIGLVWWEDEVPASSGVECGASPPSGPWVPRSAIADLFGSRAKLQAASPATGK